MNNQNKNFRMFYSQSLEPELILLEAKRKRIRIPALVWRTLFASFFYFVLAGLGTAFYLMGGNNKNGETLVYVIQGFFCFIFCAIFLIVSNYLVKYIRKLYPSYITAKALRIITVLLVSVILATPAFGMVCFIKQHILIFTFGFIFKMAFCVIFLVFPVIFLLFRVEKRFCENFKQHIISQLVPFTFPGSVYLVNGFVSRQLCMDSQLFGSQEMLYHSRYKFNGSDLVTAKIDDTALEFSQLRITEETRTLSGSSSTTSSSTQTKEIFSGLFCSMKGHIHYPGEIFIRPNTSSERFAGKLHKLFHIGAPQLKTGDIEFDTNFLCYATNEQGTLAFLTNERKKMLLQLLNEWDTTFSISFINNTVFIALASTNDIFSPTIFSSFLNIESAEKYYQHLQKIAGLTKLV